LIAPPLFESEVDSAVRRRVRRGEFTVAAAAAAQGLLDELPVDIVQDRNVRPRARQIASQFNQNQVYDATYAALAELRRCEFWTADRDFHNAVKNGLPYVRFVGEYRNDDPPAS
jgi:predicted nucleic acid-binding protein